MLKEVQRILCILFLVCINHCQMNYLDAARVIEIRLGGSKQLNKAVAERLATHQYSLVCGLLAGLPTREV